MRIFEIASHGIAGMPTGRIQLPPGHVVFPGAGAFPGLFAETLLSREIGGPAGAGSGPWFSVILDGPGGIFRLVRRVPGPTSIEVWEPHSRSFQALPFDADPSSTVAEAIGWSGVDGSFVVSAADGPSRRESAGAREERIEKLEAELAILHAVDGLQEKLDGIGYEMAQLEGERSELERLRDAKEQAASRLVAFATWSEIPDDADGVGVGAELERFRAATAEKEQQLARIEAEREQDRLRVEGLPTLSLLGDRWCWAGCGGGVVFFALGLVSPWPVLALFDIPLFGLAALRALAAVGRHQARTGVERRRLLFAEREKRVESQWSEATRIVAHWMELVGVETPEALVARLAERRQAHVDAEAVAQAFRERERAYEGKDVAGRLEALRLESGRIEGELGAALAGAYRSRQEVEAELDALRGGGSAEVGPELQLLSNAAARMGGDTASVAGWILPRASEFLAWLTEGALHALQWEGGLYALGPMGALSIDECAPSHRESIWLSLLSALLEARDAASSVPVILDDPFGPLPNRERIGPLLKGLGQRIQIVHCTDTGGWAEWVDAVVTTRAA